MDCLRLTLAFLLLAAAPAAAAQVEAKRKELSLIQKELERTRLDIEAYRGQQQTLSRELHKLESHNVEARRKIAAISRNIQAAESKRAGLKAKVGALKLASGFWSSVLADEARSYVLDAAAREDAYGTSDLWGESLRRAAMAEKAEMLASLRGFSRKTELAEAQTREQARDLAGRSLKAKVEEQSSQKKLQEKKAAAEEAEAKMAAAEKRARELEDSAKALIELLDRLSRAKAYKKTGAVAKLEVPRNSLPWPVNGEVIRFFGREKNPELNAWVIRQGVVFKAPAAAVVAAVGAGKVIYAGNFRSYGRVVILDHGASFFSIYGELGEVLRQKGASVKPGEPVGRTGPLKEGGGSLYFEIRRGVEALDPMTWLQRR
jgi:septal ring factor EnvC (AmiA/AmiB activator)